MRERKDTNILTKNVTNVKYLSLFLSLVTKWSKEGISAGLGVYIFCWLHAVINLVGDGTYQVFHTYKCIQNTSNL